MLIWHRRDDGRGNHRAHPPPFDEPPACFVIPGMVLQLPVKFSDARVSSPDLGYQHSQELFDRCWQVLIVIFGLDDCNELIEPASECRGNDTVFGQMSS